MKKYSILALALVLTVTLFAGCRRRNNTDATTLPMTEPSTQSATEPDVEMTMPTIDETIGDNGTMLPSDPTDTMESTDAANATNGTGDSANGK